MLNDFMNGLEEFKRECDEMPDEVFLAPFLEMGIKFVDVEEEKAKPINDKMLYDKIYFNVMLQQGRSCQRQLIA